MPDVSQHAYHLLTNFKENTQHKISWKLVQHFYVSGDSPKYVTFLTWLLH